MRRLLFILSFTLISLLCAAQIDEERKQIVGTWMSEEGSQSVFTNDSRYFLYTEGKLLEKGTYRIAKTDHNGNHSNDTAASKFESYLILKNKGTEWSFIIHGVSAKNLSIEPAEHRGVMLHYRLSKSAIVKPVAIPSFIGTWVEADSSHSFSVTIIPTLKNYIVGDASYFSHTRIDVSEDSGLVGGINKGNSIIVTFKSSYAGKSGKALIKKISETKIEWKIIQKPKGMFHIPEYAILRREPSDE